MFFGVKLRKTSNTMRPRLIFLVGILTASVILLCTSTVKGSPSPKKRGGSSGSKPSGSSSSSGSRSGTRTSWFGGKKTSSSSGKSPGSFGGGYKPSKSGISKKSFSNGKKWKKALAFGAGAYIGAKVLKKVNISFALSILTRIYFMKYSVAKFKFFLYNDIDKEGF